MKLCTVKEFLTYKRPLKIRDPNKCNAMGELPGKYLRNCAEQGVPLTSCHIKYQEPQHFLLTTSIIFTLLVSRPWPCNVFSFHDYT